MEDYPTEYVQDHLPLILVNGLGEANQSPLEPSRLESGTRLSFETPQCSPEQAGSVLEELFPFDATRAPYTSATSNSIRVRIRTCGKTYTLPSRKAAPLPQSPGAQPDKQGGTELHSPLSPLSPGSPVYPDGILSPQWFAKHQSQVPATIIIFSPINVAGGTSQDDAIKSTINATKAALNRSGFRVRLALVLVCDQIPSQTPELEERITSIRRMTGLDSRTGLFVMPPMDTAVDTATFLRGLLTTLRPVFNEYYKELAKHARRKKARAVIPTTSGAVAGTSLSPIDWNARYEIKQGVFAEFREEIDTAERHYSLAIYDMCGDDGVFETTTSLSRRWEEARLVSDTLARRVIKCLLQSGMTTAAVQSWFEYRNRMRGIIDRKGKGSHTYGWLAWEGRWAEVMAQLIENADLSALDSLTSPRHERASDAAHLVAYVESGKSLQSFERSPPFYALHHSGYWLRMALSLARERHLNALNIPAEDRIPPGQSPASLVARKAQEYDTYLVPEPHDEFQNAQEVGLVQNMRLVHMTELARLAFDDRNQTRMSDYLGLMLAQDLVDEGAYAAAVEILVPIWDSTPWRREEWHPAFSRLLSLLHRCTREVGNAEIALATMWELAAISSDKQLQDLAASALLDDLEIAQDVRVALDIRNDERKSPISAQFAFDNAPAYADEAVHCQILLRSTAKETVQISEVQLHISSQPTISILNEAITGDVRSAVQLTRQSNSLQGSTSLLLTAGQTRVIDLTLSFREAVSTRLNKLVLIIAGDRYRIAHSIDETAVLHAHSFYTSEDGRIVSHELRSDASTTIDVRPKPPKVQLSIKNLKSQYYVSEQPHLSIEVMNGEGEFASGTLSVLVKDAKTDQGISARVRRAGNAGDHVSDSVSLEKLEPRGKMDLVIEVTSPATPTSCVVSIEITYSLPSGSDVMLKTGIDVEIHFANLLDLKWSIEPLIYQHAWPSYFDGGQNDTPEHPSGIPQRWKATCMAQLSTTSPIILRAVRMNHEELSNASCSILTPDQSDMVEIAPSTMFERSFELLTRKISADDRHSLSLDLISEIDWSYHDSEMTHTLTTAVPRVNLPSSEPRVLCSISGNTGAADVVVDYWLENMSTHFLTFALTMEASDEFAFHGVKYRTLSLAPLSRVNVVYALFLHAKSNEVKASAAKGRWISPSLQVVDSYYHKTLDVQPAGPHVRSDGQGRLSIWVASRDGD